MRFSVGCFFCIFIFVRYTHKKVPSACTVGWYRAGIRGFKRHILYQQLILLGHFAVYYYELVRVPNYSRSNC
jgi:hypothetical protein